LSDIPGHVVPDWDMVTKREFESWEGNHHLVLDTAKLSPAQLTAAVEVYVLKRSTT
jgi:hypothetical protein